MENTNSAVIAQVPISAPAGEVTASPIADSVSEVENFSEEIGSTFDLDSDTQDFGHNHFIELNEVEEHSVSGLDDGETFESSEEDQIEEAREELDDIMKVEEYEPEKDDGYEEQIETLNATIRLLEFQRDALKEQLGGGIMSTIASLAKFFFEETLMEKTEAVEEKSIEGPSKSWKENAYLQLRKIEVKISELKQIRNSLVAKNTL